MMVSYEQIDNIGGLDYPASMVILGPSQSYKSTFISRLILEWPSVCPTKPVLKKVLVYYDIWQDLYRKLRDQVGCEIEFIQDSPSDDNLKLIENLKPNEAQIVVLDDIQDRLQEKNSNKNQIRKLFTVIAHHSNTMVMFACQDLIDGSGAMKTIRKNCTYLVVMAAAFSTGNTLEVLQRAYFSRHKNFLQSVCNHVSKKRLMSYIVVVNTTKRLIDDKFRLVSGLFDDEQLYLYSPK
jgi:hypothetical protein